MNTEENQKIILFNTASTSQFPDDFQSRFHTHIYCQRGSAKFLFNSRLYHCKKGEFIFWLAGSEVSELSVPSNFRATVLFVEKDFMTDNFPSQSWSIDAMLHSRENPILHPDNKNDEKRILTNFQLLYDRSQETTHRFYKEALTLQMQLFILEMWHIFTDQYERRKRTLQGGTLYERFLLLVQEFSIKKREVRFYSKELNITPKYLNHICKTNSGITASEWIQRYAKERIIFLLRNKNLKISETADEMEFSSRSFFTRYVQKVLGVSPREYRNQI